MKFQTFFLIKSVSLIGKICVYLIRTADFTYPLRPGESLDSVASQANLTADLIRNYNLGANFSAGSGRKGIISWKST